MVRQLRVSQAPYLAIQRFWDAEKTDALRSETLRAMKACCTQGEGGDNRTMGIDTVAKGPAQRLKEFAAEPFILAAAAAYFKRNVTRKTQAGMPA